MRNIKADSYNNNDSNNDNNKKEKKKGELGG